ncbi:MAG TPA: hypothetical protein VMU34_21130 [Mycobacterium sp.]|nr:hypothetical protein [Mycobacterium sp.]
MSDRTFDTWWSAFRTIGDLWGRDALKAAILAATRPNGSVNVAKFKRAADMAVMRYVMEMEADEPEPDDDCDD